MEIIGIVLAIAALGFAVVTYVAPAQGWFGAPSLRFSYGAQIDYNFELWVDIENEEITNPLLRALKVYRLDANISINVQAEQIGDGENKAGPLHIGGHDVMCIVGGTSKRFILVSKHNAEKTPDYPAFLGKTDYEGFDDENYNIYFPQGNYYLHIDIRYYGYGKTVRHTKRFRVRSNALDWID